MASHGQPAVKLEDSVEVKLEDPVDEVRIDLSGAVRKHWAGLALTTYHEAAKELPRDSASRFPNKAHAQGYIIATLEEKLDIPVFKCLDRHAALSILCEDVIKELMTRGSISFENARDSREACALKEDLVPVRRYPMASLRDRQQSGEDEVQVLLETLNAANKDDWVEKFFATASVRTNQRPKKFVGRGAARNYLVSKVLKKFDIFTPASDQERSSFNSACDLALNALQREGHLRWPTEHVRTPPTPAVKPKAPTPAVNPQVLTPAVNISLKDIPEFQAGVNEARRSGYSDGFNAGRVAGRAEMRAENVLRQHFNSAGPDDSGTAHTRGLSESSVEDAAESVDALERTSTLPKSPRGSPILESPYLGGRLHSPSNKSPGTPPAIPIADLNVLGRTRLQTASMVRKRSMPLEDGEIKEEPQTKKRNRL